MPVTACLSLQCDAYRDPALEAGQYEACQRMGCGEGEALVVPVIGTAFYLGSLLSYF